MAWEKPAKRQYKKKHKYSAKKSVSFDGHCFGSKLEKRTYEHLKLLEKAGEIRVLQTQVHVKMTKANIVYIPDFLIEDVVSGEKIWVEAKGIETPEWKLKKRLWKHYGPGRLQIYRAHKTQGCILTEEVISLADS